MASKADVDSARQRLEEIWGNPPARDGRFGNCLKTVTVKDIRGLSVALEFQWPVSAIGGVNGSGKTTVLQVCSAAYSAHGSGRRHYTLGRWIGPALTGETPPIATTAEVAYSFWDATPGLVVPYQVARKRWGYPRRGNPERNVSFVGITAFAPRIEKLDRTHQNRARLNILETTTFDPRTVESVSRVLGSPYDAAALHTVSVAAADWRDYIPQLTRGDDHYTEAHMGAGEQKIIRLVQFLENLPEKSLVLLEEPELTLHPDAQFGLAWYLMTLARRKGHQVLIATHSPHIFEALPREARVLLTRDTRGVEVLHGVSQLSAARELSSSVRSNRDLVFVEDVVAVRFLTEIWRRYDQELSRDATIIPIGSATDVQRMVTRLRSQGVRCVGVRDPDQGDDVGHGLFSLPGDASPEALLLEGDNLERGERLLAGVKAAADLARVVGYGYTGSEAAKRVFSGVASGMAIEPELVADRLTLAWLSEPDCAAAAQRLVAAIRAALDSCERG